MYNAELMVYKMKDTEIAVIMEAEHNGLFLNALVAFDIETKEARVICEVTEDAAGELLRTAPVTLRLMGNSLTTSTYAHVLGETTRISHNVVDVKSLDTHYRKDASIAYACANFAYSIEFEGKDPVEMVKEAYKNYWAKHKPDASYDWRTLDPFEGYEDVGVKTKEFYDEYLALFSTRSEAFTEDLLDKWEHGSKFSLVEKTIDTPFSKIKQYYIIEEYIPSQKSMDRYMVDKELFETAKKVLPYYGYIIKDNDENQFFAATNEGPPMLLYNKSENPLDLDMLFGAMEASKLLWDVGIQDEDVCEALVEYAKTIKRPHGFEHRQTDVYTKYDANSEALCDKIDAIKKQIQAQRDARERAVKEGGFIDISKNRLSMEYERESRRQR